MSHKSALAALAITFSLARPAPALAAPVSVPAIGANDLKPSECASATLTALVVGTGTVNGTSAAELILGGPGGDTLSGAAGNDCLVAGDGIDILDGGAGTDICISGPGLDLVFLGCETAIQ